MKLVNIDRNIYEFQVFLAEEEKEKNLVQILQKFKAVGPLVELEWYYHSTRELSTGIMDQDTVNMLMEGYKSFNVSFENKIMTFDIPSIYNNSMIAYKAFEPIQEITYHPQGATFAGTGLSVMSLFKQKPTRLLTDQEKELWSVITVMDRAVMMGNSKEFKEMIELKE